MEFDYLKKNQYGYLELKEYKSQEELYQGLIPAIHLKLKGLQKSKNVEITEDDIWNYLKETKWKKSVDLELYQMVSDIMNADNELVNDYLTEKLYSRSRIRYFEGDLDEEK